MALTLTYSPVPFDDTYVLYNPDDKLSLAAVFFTLLPIGILVFYLSWFIVTREIEPVIMAAGQVVNDIVNNVVKNHIRQERPMKIVGFQENGLRSGYGMPSAHSQFMGFFAVFLMLRIWLQWRGLTVQRKVVSSIGLIVLSACVVSSRVYLHYHSWIQVAVGVLIGSGIGILHFSLASWLRSTKVIDYLLSWKIVEFFWIKDSVYQEPLSLRQEHEEWLRRKGSKAK
jgi:dolichyldiphosphatase